jgi:hypothetical protein
MPVSGSVLLCVLVCMDTSHVFNLSKSMLWIQASIESIVLQCKSRKGEFGLDLLGLGALAVLKKVLHPMSRSVTLGYLFSMQVQHLS